MSRMRVRGTAHFVPGRRPSDPAIVVVRPLGVSFDIGTALVAGENESNLAAIKRHGLDPYRDRIVLSLSITDAPEAHEEP